MSGLYGHTVQAGYVNSRDVRGNDGGGKEHENGYLTSPCAFITIFLKIMKKHAHSCAYHDPACLH